MPCDENGKVYQADQTISDNGRIGTVRKDANGGYYIEWTEVTLTPDQIDSAGHVTEAAKTFTGTLYVKPRDGFLGGNNVPTNGENSGVYTADNNQIKPFPRPEVNVPIKLDAQNVTKNILFIIILLHRKAAPNKYSARLVFMPFSCSFWKEQRSG